MWLPVPEWGHTIRSFDVEGLAPDSVVVGRFDHEVAFTVDEKRRFQLPVRWRMPTKDEKGNPIENECLRMLTWRTPDKKLPCLLVLPEGPARELAETIEELPMNNVAAENLRRWFGRGYRAKVDNMGRITIPESLLDKAQLRVRDEAIAISLGDRFQLWSQRMWAKQEQSDEDHLDLAMELLAVKRGQAPGPQEGAGLRTQSSAETHQER